MELSRTEQGVVAAIAAKRDDLIALTSELIGFDTITHTAGAPPRQERELQEHLAALLRRHGAEVELHEPDASALRPHPMVPDDLEFDGRPQLVARFRGSGGGRTLLLNGHVDVVDAEPRADWTQRDPFIAEVRGTLLYGRGACDMKGGVAQHGDRRLHARRARRAAGGRRDRQHGHRGGVDGRRRPLRRAHPCGRCGDRSGAERTRRLGRVPRQPAAAHHDPGPRGACGHPSAPRPPKAARSTRSRRWRSSSRRSAACASTGRSAGPPVSLRRRLRADDRLGRRMARQLPGLVHARMPHRIPARQGHEHGYGALVEQEFWTGSGRRRAATTGCF